MSRSTQFIGLTDDAKNFVSKLDKIESYNSTIGMFGEEIPLGMWRSENCTYKEVVVATPWSSGPMIFTAVATYFDNHEPKKDPNVDKPDSIYFDWVLNPTLTEEVDEIRGHYYV